MPITADIPMIAMGWSFLKASTAPRANMPSESQKPTPENAAVCKPFGKKTVIQTDRNAAPIRPITAGRRPYITPSTAQLFRNLS